MGTMMLLSYLSTMRTITGELCLRARWYYIYTLHICTLSMYGTTYMQCFTSQSSTVLDGILVFLYVLLSISSIRVAGKRTFEFIILPIFM